MVYRKQHNVLQGIHKINEKQVNALMDREYNKWQMAVTAYRTHESEKPYREATAATNHYNKVCRAYCTWQNTGELVL